MILKGTYEIYEGDELIATIPNVICTGAKEAILKYLARRESNWAGTIAVGVGDTAAVSGDTLLEFEIGWATPFEYVADLDNSEVVASARFESGTVGKIYELGVYSLGTPVAQNNFIDLDPNVLTATNGTAETTNHRIGSNGLLITANPSTTTTCNLDGVFLDFSDLSFQDDIVFSYFADANVTSVEIRFISSAGKYLSYTFTPVAGYNIEKFARGDLVATGGATISDPVGDIDILVTAGGTQTNFTADAISVVNIFSDNITRLVSRTVLGTPITKGTAPLTIKYRIEFAI